MWQIKVMITLVFLVVLYFCNIATVDLTQESQLEIIQDYFLKLVKVQHVLLYDCKSTDILKITKLLQNLGLFVKFVHLNGSYNLTKVLKSRVAAKTANFVHSDCQNTHQLLISASNYHYFNISYEWLLWDMSNSGLNNLMTQELKFLGPNSQLTYINHTDNAYQIWDVYSRGKHLAAPLEVTLVAEKFKNNLHTKLIIYYNLSQLRFKNRQNFKGLTLRGVSVIDQENITNNEQVESILARNTKDPGVSAFSKYHYELLSIVRDYLNFTVNFRNARGWAGRLGNTSYRLGYLGILKRNEADIGASAAFNRINRFAEFDIIHQSWKFETGFLYRFTPDLDTHGKSGNFLAPFDDQVWFVACSTLLALNTIWRLISHIRNISELQLLQDTHETTISGVFLKTFAAVCQQGLDPIPSGSATRIIIITTFLFSVVMYNYYTSSVVGGLLSSTARGPATVDEVVFSGLKVSFEDIGYYKVLFRENKSKSVTNLLKLKVLPARLSTELPVYAHIDEAVPYIKRGDFAFHCEVVDAYPEIAKHFDVNEICDLRVVTGLLETELMNWIVTKNSVYTEMFRNVMIRAREVGLVERLLHQRQPKKPACQALYTVYPVSFSGVAGAYLLLMSASLSSLIILCVEVFYVKYKLKKLCGNTNK